MREIRIDSESANEVITFQDLKAWGKIPGTADDGLVTGMIKAVRQLQEQWTGRNFIGKTMTVQWDQVREAVLDIPFGPVRTVTSIKRVYEDGTLSAALTEGTDYFLSGLNFQKINLYKRWQSAGQIVTGVRCVYTSGHGDGSGQVPLPDPIKQALLRHVLTDYDQRDDLEVYQPTLYQWARTALQPYKVAGLWL